MFKFLPSVAGQVFILFWSIGHVSPVSSEVVCLLGGTPSSWTSALCLASPDFSHFSSHHQVRSTLCLILWLMGWGGMDCFIVFIFTKWVGYHSFNKWPFVLIVLWAERLCILKRKPFLSICQVILQEFISARLKTMCFKEASWSICLGKGWAVWIITGMKRWEQFWVNFNFFWIFSGSELVKTWM